MLPCLEDITGMWVLNSETEVVNLGIALVAWLSPVTVVEYDSVCMYM